MNSTIFFDVVLMFGKQWFFLMDGWMMCMFVCVRLWMRYFTIAFIRCERNGEIELVSSQYRERRNTFLAQINMHMI